MILLKAKRAPNRRYLESTLIPMAATLVPDAQILYVGVAIYTRDYERRFRPATLYTLDVDPAVARYGARRHTTASICDAEALYRPASFDLVFVFGVIGWGLDSHEDIEAAMESSWGLLKHGGVLVVSVDDIPSRNTVPLDEIKALTKFQPYAMPGLSVSRVRIDDPKFRTILSFFQKPSPPS